MPGEGVIPNVMKFIVVGELGHVAPIPPALVPIDFIPETESVLTRDFVLRLAPDACTGTKWLINGLLWDDITEFPVRGTTEIWRFINRSSVTHPMHMHLVHFQVLDRQQFTTNGDEIIPVGDPVPAPENERGWKDTVQAHPNEIVRVIATFEPFTGLYPYHCHILEHEDHEMMRQFQVVAPPCPADLDGDGAVGSSDLAALLGSWGPGAAPADLNGDGNVNASDLAALLGSWGPCP
jgi:spore coat protein A